MTPPPASAVPRPRRRGRRWAHRAALAAVLACCGCAGTVYQPRAGVGPAMPLMRARSTADALFRQAVPGGSLSFGSGEITVTKDRATRTFPLLEIDAPAVKDAGPLAGQYRMGDRYVVFIRGMKSLVCFRELRDAREFVDALHALREAERDPFDEEAFREIAETWRGKVEKPPLPQLAERLKAQAEVAVEQGRYPDAIDRYGEALQEAPWWPEGRHRRALLLAEEGFYDEAVAEMERFLQLAPEAQDARDLVRSWERLAPAGERGPR